MENKEFLLASIDYKISLCHKKNKIQNTVFCTDIEMTMIHQYLLAKKEKRYFFSGGFEDAQRKVFVAYPEKFDELVAQKSISMILKAIKIELPNELMRKV